MCTSFSIINNIFSNYVDINIPNFVVVFTDGSVSSLSAAYSFFISELRLFFTNNLHPSSPSFATECFSIIHTLTLVSNFVPDKFLIASDSLSCPLNSHLSPLIFRIKLIVTRLHQSNFYGSLATSTSNLIRPFIYNLPFAHFIPILRRHTSKLWLSQRFPS